MRIIFSISILIISAFLLSGNVLAQTVKKAGDVWVSSVNGKNIKEPHYENSSNFSEGLAQSVWQKKWGFIDISGKYFFQGTIEEARNYKYGLAPVKIAGKWGYYDKNGKIAIENKFDYAHPFEFSKGKYASVKFNGKWEYIDQTGAIKKNLSFNEVPPPPPVPNSK